MAPVGPACSLLHFENPRAAKGVSYWWDHESSSYVEFTGKGNWLQYKQATRWMVSSFGFVSAVFCIWGLMWMKLCEDNKQYESEDVE